MKLYHITKDLNHNGLFYPRIPQCRAEVEDSEPLTTHTSTGDPPTLAGRSGSVFYRVTALFP